MAKNDNTNKPDWAEIKYEYVSSKKFLTDIAEEFKVPYSTLYKRATRENWPTQRQIFGEKADKKVYNRKTNAVARRYQDIDEAYGRIAAQLNDSVDPDGRELYLYPVYDENGKAIWPKIAINYTQKTQYVFRISKGVYDETENKKVNDKVRESEIPYQNMIYFGDGITDIPCMTLIKKQGGVSIAV